MYTLYPLNIIFRKLLCGGRNYTWMPNEYQKKTRWNSSTNQVKQTFQVECIVWITGRMLLRLEQGIKVPEAVSETETSNKSAWRNWTFKVLWFNNWYPKGRKYKRNLGKCINLKGTNQYANIIILPLCSVSKFSSLVLPEPTTSPSIPLLWEEGIAHCQYANLVIQCSILYQTLFS